MTVHDVIRSDLRECARCGRGHVGLAFRKMERPVEHADGVVASHWAACPTNGDPVLMVVLDGPTPDELASVRERMGR